jgi:hypothetical protein
MIARLGFRLAAVYPDNITAVKGFSNFAGSLTPFFALVFAYCKFKVSSV